MTKTFEIESDFHVELSNISTSLQHNRRHILQENAGNDSMCSNGLVTYKQRNRVRIIIIVLSSKSVEYADKFSD